MNGSNKQKCYISQGCKALQGQTLYLIGPIGKLRRKWIVVNTVPGAVCTIPYFIRNLQMDPISKSVTVHLAVKPCKDKHSRLLGLSVSYKENEMLWIHYLELYLQHLILFITYKWAT